MSDNKNTEALHAPADSIWIGAAAPVVLARHPFLLAAGRGGGRAGGGVVGVRQCAARLPASWRRGTSAASGEQQQTDDGHSSIDAFSNNGETTKREFA